MLLCPWDSPGKNTGVGCHDLLQGIFLPQKLNLSLLYYGEMLYHLSHQRREGKLLSRVQLFATPWTVAHQAPLPMGLSRQEYWSGLPLPSPLEKSLTNNSNNIKQHTFYPSLLPK